MKSKTVRNNVLRFMKLDPANLIVAKQIHGNNVKVVNSLIKDNVVADCDGLITANKKIILGIYTADCIPLLMYVGNSELKVAIHIGWRGLYSGIIENAIELLKNRFYVNFGKIKAYIGPHICPSCYEVGNEICSVFDIEDSNKLNLSKIVCEKLNKFGVINTNIFDIKLCTFHINNLFFSYRRTKCDERIMSVIV
ncbi:MAG: polyphenol oxidase family protein [Endomicrobium sp.]|nr:polyphenol oxidase family protein [Endomicrobium sp.]